ncbi:PqqD family protein [Halobacteriovorax sp. JY17]|uniref:PqqD family protein n=1 Tax=Halobacteriovorax sp. JY17 TaxID=2014617 RepID=UPI000C4FF711|nr:PqqD family protein [Halobacteriovorax sp. JY17]PIK13616.1 MAG: hypothetical protein CES88_15610 [Halobacteriovorax sp. JY17]
MFLKRGRFNKEQTVNKSKPILMTPEGKSFQVTYMSAFIWEELDGKTSISDVSKKIENTSKINKPELSNIVESIILQLRDVGLVSQIN